MKLRAGTHPHLKYSLLAASFMSGFSLPGSAWATSYYVSTNGSDSNAGTSTSTPFLTLQTAESITKPGDTVYVMAGTYTATCAGCDVVEILLSGTAASPITYAAYPGSHPIIDTSLSWQGFHIDASYITVTGFEIVGDSKSITMSQATAAAPNPSYQTAGSGIVVESNLKQACQSGQTGCLNSSNQPCQPSQTTCYIFGATTPNHVSILDNIVHDEPGSGIEVDDADYVTVSSNTAYRNAFWSPWGQSGISLFELTDTDSVTSYKNYVTNNFVYLNQQMIPTNNSNPPGTITDGNGIIIDDNEKTYSSNIAYNGRTLVGNNVASSNGGSGMHSFSSQHIDFFANTAYTNNQTQTNVYGQMFSYDGADINFLNNIMWAQPNKPWMSNNGNRAGVNEDYNLLWISSGSGSLGGMAAGAHNVTANPLFTNASAGTFSITSTSPARGAATSSLELATDVAGTKRPQAHGYDIGAYESTSP